MTNHTERQHDHAVNRLRTVGGTWPPAYTLPCVRSHVPPGRSPWLLSGMRRMRCLIS